MANIGLLRAFILILCNFIISQLLRSNTPKGTLFISPPRTIMGNDINNSNEEEDVDGSRLNEYDRDKIQKQSLVLHTIASACTTSSQFPDVRSIATALESKRYSLGIQNLSGGYTNYTYKVFLVSSAADDDDVPETALFVKLCFPRAFWNPDPHYVYNVERIANEYEMMIQFAKLAPGCVANPYLLLDVGDMKLLATQWSPDDEQMGNQFIDGVGDFRVAKNLAAAIATLHCSPLDANFNTEARDCMIDIFPSMEEEMTKMARNETANSRTTELAKKLGVDGCSRLFEAATKSYREQDIPCHADLHMFNIMVEKKPQIDFFSERDDIFGANGTFCICDWEMAMRGPLGLDNGRVYSIPVTCILAHAISGNSEVADGMISWLNLYWQEYSNAMTKIGGKSTDFLCKSYRNAMAWLGWKLYAISIFDWFIPFLPIESDGVGSLKESLGVVGITLLKLGFGEGGEGLTLAELHSRLNTTITDEVSHIKSLRRGKPSLRRKSSVLRQSNRRVSDAFKGMGRESMKKMMSDLAKVHLDDN